MLILLYFLCLLIFKVVFLNSASVQFNMMRTIWAKEMLSYINDTVDPCDDFYEFACGNWEQFNPIPEDDIENNEFIKLDKMLLHQTIELIEKPIHTFDSEVEKKAKEFYASCIDIETRKKRGLEPLLKFIKSTGGWPLLDERWSEKDFNWIDVISKFISEYGISILLSVTVEDNVWNVSQNQIYISGVPLLLIYNDYYYNSSKSFLLNAYQQHMLDIFKLFGVEDGRAQKESDEILKFEKDIAMKALYSNVRLDFKANSVPMTMGNLQANHPTVDWYKFVEKSLGIRVNSSYPVTIVGDDYISNLVQVVSTANQKVIANYIMWMVTKDLLEYTDNRFDLAEQKYMKSLIGSLKRPERWNYCIWSTKDAFAFVIGAMYIRKHFNPAIKNDIQDLGQSIKKTFKARLEDFNWIDMKTTETLHDKIEKMQLEVGYPEYIMIEENLRKEYEEVEVDPKKYFENVVNLTKDHQRKRRAKRIKELDRSARFDPLMVNAFYQFQHNRLTVPAGIIQYPFYNRQLPHSSNFGRIGSILGHEVIHGFDDIGVNFDSTGNMVKWWTESSEKTFKQKLSCFVSQYNNYTYNGYKLRGDKLVGENIADVGGLLQAYYAYKKWLEEQDDDVLERETLPELDFTSTQLFFLSYAQMWCETQTPEALRLSINIDNHTPSKYRVIGSLSNLDEFAKEFRCSVDSNMNSRPKCELW